MVIHRSTVVALVLGLLIGYWSATSPRSPIHPDPVPGRPIVSAFVRLTKVAARLGLWFALAAEPAPQAREPQLARSLYDAEGHPVVDHAEGW